MVFLNLLCCAMKEIRRSVLGLVTLFSFAFLCFRPCAGAENPIAFQQKRDSIFSVDSIPEIRISAKRNAAIVPVQTLSGKELEKLSSNSVADALRYYSGVQIKDYGGIGGLKTAKGYADTDMSGGRMHRLLAAVAISLTLTALLALSFIMLAGSGEPPVLSIEEQVGLIGFLDGMAWKGDLGSILPESRGNIVTRKGHGDILILSAGSDAIKFRPGPEGLSAACGRTRLFLYYSEGKDGRGGTLTIRSELSSVFLTAL